MFASQVKVQIGESTSIILNKKKNADYGGKKHFSVPFSPHKPRLFHLLTEKKRAYAVHNGLQSAYSNADTKNFNKNRRSKKFS